MMTGHAEPTQDLEVYLAYGRPQAQYAAFADVRHKLRGVAPLFDFDRAMTSPHLKVITVRDDAQTVRAIAVVANDRARPAYQLYFADDAQSTQALMGEVAGVS